MSTSLRAQTCVDDTNNKIKIKIGDLLGLTVAEYLKPSLSEQSQREFEIAQTVWGLLGTVPAWAEVFRELGVHTCSTIKFAEDAISFSHPPIHSTITCEIKPDSGLLVLPPSYGPIEVEEIVSVSKMYKAVRTELPNWQYQFRPGGWTELGLSQMCAISPAYRACLVNIGVSWRKQPSATITTYKQGPRLSSITPMPPELAKALRVAASLP